MEAKSDFNDKANDQASFSSQELNKFVYVQLSNDKTNSKPPPVAIRPKLVPGALQIPEVQGRPVEAVVIKQKPVVSSSSTVTISKMNPNATPVVGGTAVGGQITLHSIAPTESVPPQTSPIVSIANGTLGNAVLHSIQTVSSKYAGGHTKGPKLDADGAKPLSIPLKTKKLVLYNQSSQASLTSKLETTASNALKTSVREENCITVLTKPIISPNNSVISSPFSSLKDQAQIASSSLPVLSLNKKLQISNGTIHTVNYSSIQENSSSDLQVIKVTDFSAKENHSPPEINIDSLKSTDVLEPSPPKVQPPAKSPCPDTFPEFAIVEPPKKPGIETAKKPEPCGPLLTNDNSKVIIKTDSITVRKKMMRDKVSPLKVDAEPILEDQSDSVKRPLDSSEDVTASKKIKSSLDAKINHQSASEEKVGDSLEDKVASKNLLGGTTSAKRIHHSRKASHKEKSQTTKVLTNESEILRCNFCGCYGVREDFIVKRNLDFCGEACSQEYQFKNLPEVPEKPRKTRKPKVSLGKGLNSSKPRSESPVPTVVPYPFSWSTYLEGCAKINPSSKAAPEKIWTDPYQELKYNLKPGMKLEGIDPQHQSLFCVMTVMDVVGPRVRLHFDGCSERFDFWTNVSSSHLFPVGWCKENNRTLQAPIGISNFTWKAYLKLTRSAGATKAALPRKVHRSPNLFEPGMKLEAEDRKNNWVCVATVVDVVESEILVNFDGWDPTFDVWFDVESPYIHPAGWCNNNHVRLFPPNNYHFPFDWSRYLKETKSKGAPNCIFKPRRPRDFRVNMKLEVMDKRNPRMLRVATIVGVHDFRLKIHFDGWEDIYDYWVDDDSPDIHPPGWAEQTGYTLESPRSSGEEAISKCGIPGCQGDGHITEPTFTSHYTSHGCPYAIQNLEKDWELLLPDRLEYLHTEKAKHKSAINLLSGKYEEQSHDSEFSCKRIRKRRRFFDEITEGEAEPKLKCSKPMELVKIQPLEPSPPPPEAEPPVTIDPKAPCHLTIHQDIFNPPDHPNPPVPCVASREYAIDHLLSESHLPRKNLGSYTKQEVRTLLETVSGCYAYVDHFMEEEIDGSVLQYMNPKSLINQLGMRMGPAIKLSAVISRLRK